MIYFRRIRLEDKDEIKTLHQEWFPVSYKDDFYDELVKNRMFGTGQPLFCCLACFASEDTHQGCSHNNNHHHHQHQQLQKQQQQQDPIPLLEGFHQERREERIVGCVVGCFVDISSPQTYETAALLVDNPQAHVRMFYIMTLGCVTEFRHEGLGTTLVQKCISLVEADPRCGVCYLHVITYNAAAIRLYEKLKFRRVKEIEGYYTIEGKEYNCYLYARYFHGEERGIVVLDKEDDSCSLIGNRGHMTVLQILSDSFSTFCRGFLTLSIFAPITSYLRVRPGRSTLPR